ncbi:MAG: IS66-like element accessory protein TnpA [Nevskiaceae bacterium]
MTREVIATVERRRKWPDEEKVRIMSEALAPGATASAVADRNGVCRSLLYAWLRLARRGELAGISLSSPKAAAMRFAAVEVAGPRAPAVAHEPVAQTPAKTPAASTACIPLSGRRRSTSIEIVLTNGRVVKADEGIDPAALARLVAALEGDAS